MNPRVRATDLGQGPNLRRGVRAGSLRATEPRAREKTRGRKRKKIRSTKKTHLYIAAREFEIEKPHLMKTTAIVLVDEVLIDACGVVIDLLNSPPLSPRAKLLAALKKGHA